MRLLVQAQTLTHTQNHHLEILIEKISGLNKLILIIVKIQNEQYLYTIVYTKREGVGKNIIN